MARKSEGDILDSLADLSAADLHAVIEKATGLHREKIEAAKSELLDEVRQKAMALGISLEQLMPQHAPVRHRAAQSGGRATVAAKFRGPSGETWSGRGKMPNWMRDLEATGRNRQEFAIAS